MPPPEEEPSAGRLSVFISAETSANAGTLIRVRCLSVNVSAVTGASQDINLFFELCSALKCPWSDYAGILDPFFFCPWTFSVPLDWGGSLLWEFPWAETGLADLEVMIDWGPVGPQDAETVIPWTAMIRRDLADLLPWFQGVETDPGFVLPWDETDRADVNVILPWDRTARADLAIDLPWSLVAAVDLETRLAWLKMQAVDPSSRVPWGKSIPLDVTNFTEFEREYIKQALFKDWNLPWIAVSRIIMYKQNISMTRVSDGAAVRILSGSIDLDVDSWAWELRVTLPSRADADLVRPDPSTGDMVEVELVINGHGPWRFLVKSIQENYAWAKGTYNVIGYSPSFLLGDPGPRITNVYGGQPAETVVSDLLSGTGFSYTWDLLGNTWNLAADSLSVTDSTMINIIKRIPAAVGGVVQTDPGGYNLVLQSRYPISPKNWPTSTAYETLSSGILSMGADPDPQPKFNQVVVSGEIAGVIGTVRREGTDGGNPAPPVVDPLLTNQAVVTERGRVELDSAGYNRVDETLLLPLPGLGLSPKLLTPGRLVLVQDLFASWWGQVKGVSVTWERAKTRQRVVLERVYL
jgi:hypothetical protein